VEIYFYFKYEFFFLQFKNLFVLFYFETAPAIERPHPAISRIQQQQQHKNVKKIYVAVIIQNENK
jgi:hypothetical protein